jgi:hypothetical protein
MISNIKLPHWLMGLFGAVAILLPWLLKQESSGAFVVPSWVIPVENGLILVLGYLGFSSPSVSPMVNARAMAKYTAAAGVLIFGFGLSQISCKPGSVPSGVVGPTIQTVVCIISEVSTDLASGKSWEIAIADTVSVCGTDAASIVSVWDAHVKAEVTEGVTPKYALPKEGGL